MRNCALTPAEVKRAIGRVSQTVRHVKGREEREELPSFSCELVNFHDRGYKTNKDFLKKQVNEFIRVKI